MLVAALYDIHANFPALRAVLEEIRRLGVDQVIVGGDVLPGPMPRETLTSLLELDIPTPFIYGNGEVAVLEQLAGRTAESSGYGCSANSIEPCGELRPRNHETRD